MDTDKDVLISKVYSRRAIWDRRLPAHASRNIVDSAWKEIAAELGVEDDTFLRKKWKNLRGQFAIELGKLCQGQQVCKWPYFRSLMFLADVVTPRTSSSRPKYPWAQRHDADEADVTTSHPAQPMVVDHTDDSDISCTEEDRPPLETLRQSNKRKRSDVDSENNQENVDRKTASDVDDALFFRSLLPYVSKIPGHRKLRFRNRVQQLVEDFMCSDPPNVP